MKLSSPYLNVLIIAGAILIYVDVILFGVDEGIASASTAGTLCMVCDVSCIVQCTADDCSYISMYHIDSSLDCQCRIFLDIWNSLH